MTKVRRGRDDVRRRRTFSVVRGTNARQLLAVAAAILLIVTAVLAVPRSRDAIADLLGIDGLRIRTGEGPVPTSTSVPASSNAASAVHRLVVDGRYGRRFRRSRRWGVT